MGPGPVLLPAAILWKGKWKMELFWKLPPLSQIWLKSADWFENHGGEGNGKVDRRTCTDWMIIRVLFLQESKLETVLKVSSCTALSLSSLTSLIFWFYHCMFQLKKFSSPFLCKFFFPSQFHPSHISLFLSILIILGVIIGKETFPDKSLIF